MADTRYTVEVFGGCLGEWLPDGTKLVADPEAEIRPLDLVSIHIRDSDGPWARFMRAAGEEFGAAVKMFLGWTKAPDGSGLCIVGQLVPPVACLIPEAEIEALHKIIGSAGAQPQMTERDRASWNLVAPFARVDAKPALKAAIAE